MLCLKKQKKQQVSLLTLLDFKKGQNFKLIKNYYYNVAEQKAKTIEEIDCLIEEYKNIKKINVSSSIALFLSFGSIFILTITNIFSMQVNIRSNMLSLFPKLVEQEVTNGEFKQVTDITSVQEPIIELLTILMVSIVLFIIYALLYNRFNQSRLSGFYNYKRFLLRQQ